MLNDALYFDRPGMREPIHSAPSHPESIRPVSNLAAGDSDQVPVSSSTATFHL